MHQSSSTDQGCWSPHWQQQVSWLHGLILCRGLCIRIVSGFWLLKHQAFQAPTMFPDQSAPLPMSGSHRDIAYVVRKLLTVTGALTGMLQFMLFTIWRGHTIYNLDGGWHDINWFYRPILGWLSGSSMGYYYTMGSGMISWSARKQKVVAASSTYHGIWIMQRSSPAQNNAFITAFANIATWRI